MTDVARDDPGDLAEIDRICDRFEADWKSGRRPSIEEYARNSPERLRARLLAELMVIDLEYRNRVGETGHAGEYAELFTELVGPDHGVPLDPGEVVTIARAPDESGDEDIGFTTDLPFDDFELLEEVGGGTFGVVWRAREVALERIVAVKLPRGQVQTTNEEFLHEARAQANLEHENIVRIHRVGTERSPYIVSEFCEGGSLKGRLAEPENAPSARDAATWCHELARAMQHAHEHGVVHRDLKPANVMFHQERLKVTDFGLAKRLDGDSLGTHSDAVMGSPAYMSPEQAAGRSRDVDARSDVYSLGVMLYEMLAGEIPFKGTVGEVLDAVRRDEPMRPSKRRRQVERKKTEEALAEPATSASKSTWRLGGNRFHVPRDLETICLKAMEKDPSRRYQTADEFAADLRRFLDHEPIRARRVGLHERAWRWARRNPGWSATLLATVATTIAAVYLFAIRPADTRTPVRLETFLGLDREDREPVSAHVVFVPLDEKSGEPVPERLIDAGWSPIRTRLEPGDYLVVAAVDEERFAEVFRRVPADLAALPGAYSHENWKAENGIAELPSIRIPQTSVVEDMVPIERSDGTIAFYMDSHEFTYAEFREHLDDPLDGRWERPPTDQHAMTHTCDRALGVASMVGKRLPTRDEYVAAATRFGEQKFPWGSTSREWADFAPASDGRPDFGPVTTPQFDRIAYPRGVVYGLCSNVAEWTSTRPSGTVKVPLGQRPRPDGVGTPEPDRDVLLSEERVRLGAWSGAMPLRARIVVGGDLGVIDGDPSVDSRSRSPTLLAADRIPIAAFGQPMAKLSRGLGFRFVRSARPRLRAIDFADGEEP